MISQPGELFKVLKNLILSTLGQVTYNGLGITFRKNVTVELEFIVIVH